MPESPRIAELKRRVQSDPASIAFAALAEEYRRSGRYEEAIAICQTGLERHPSYISAHVTLGRALLETGRYDAAREELESVLRVAPENLAAIRGLAEIHRRHRQTSDTNHLSASAMAEMAAALAPVEQPAEAAAPSLDITTPKINTTPTFPPPPEITTAPEVASAPAFLPPPEIIPPREDFAAPQGLVSAADLAPAERVALPPQFGPVDEAAAPEDVARPPAPEPPPQVSIAVVTQAPAARPDPVLEGLEALLHAIVRARQSTDGLHLS